MAITLGNECFAELNIVPEDATVGTVNFMDSDGTCSDRYIHTTNQLFWRVKITPFNCRISQIHRT